MKSLFLELAAILSSAASSMKTESLTPPDEWLQAEEEEEAEHAHDKPAFLKAVLSSFNALMHTQVDTVTANADAYNFLLSYPRWFVILFCYELVILVIWRHCCCLSSIRGLWWRLATRSFPSSTCCSSSTAPRKPKTSLLLRPSSLSFFLFQRYSHSEILISERLDVLAGAELKNQKATQQNRLRWNKLKDVVQVCFINTNNFGGFLFESIDWSRLILLRFTPVEEIHIRMRRTESLYLSSSFRSR